MLKQILKKLIKQKTEYYDMFLVNSQEVYPYMRPTIVRQLKRDINIEFYLVDPSERSNSYVIAVIAVKRGNRVFRQKYDGGRLLDDGIEGMVKDCLEGIRLGWDLRLFIKWADESFVKETSWLDKWVYGI